MQILYDFKQTGNSNLIAYHKQQKKNNKNYHIFPKAKWIKKSEWIFVLLSNIKIFTEEICVWDGL